MIPPESLRGILDDRERLSLVNDAVGAGAYNTDSSTTTS
jgi:hypothetical protein